MDIATMVTSTRAAYDIAKGISSLKSDVERNESVAKVLEILLSVQSDALEMKEKHHLFLEEISDLKKQIMEFEKWSETEKQYELKELASGVLAYALKQTDESSNPFHLLCAKCYNDRKKSILQRVSKTMAGVKYICHTCKSEILDHSQETPPSSSYPGRGGGGSNSWMGA